MTNFTRVLEVLKYAVILIMFLVFAYAIFVLERSSWNWLIFFFTAALILYSGVEYEDEDYD